MLELQIPRYFTTTGSAVPYPDQTFETYLFLTMNYVVAVNDFTIKKRTSSVIRSSLTD